MKRVVFALVLSWAVFLGRSGFGQPVFPRYYQYAGLVQRADSLAGARQFAQAAGLYARAARVQVEKAVPVSRADVLYQSARAWSRAGVPDSAFQQLGAVARLGYTQVDSLLLAPALRVLHPDARWPQVVARVRANAQRADRLAQAYHERTALAVPTEDIVFAPPKEFLRQFIFNDTLPLVSINHGNFRLFFRANSYTAAHLPALKAQLAVALPRVLEVLHLPAYRQGVNLVLVDSKQELGQLTGLSPGGGFALPGYEAVFLVNNPARRLQAKHELFHLLANNVWGETQSRLLNEGSAVFSDNECWYENPIYGIGAYMLRNGKLLPLKALIEDFDHVALTQQVAAYLQSAAVFKYLYEQYGLEKMQQLWKAGFGEFQRIYGFPVSRLEKEWKALLRKTTPPALNWEKLTKEGCG
jgi:hypothetical protein